MTVATRLFHPVGNVDGERELGEPGKAEAKQSAEVSVVRVGERNRIERASPDFLAEIGFDEERNRFGSDESEDVCGPKDQVRYDGLWHVSKPLSNAERRPPFA